MGLECYSQCNIREVEEKLEEMLNIYDKGKKIFDIADTKEQRNSKINEEENVIFQNKINLFDFHDRNEKGIQENNNIQNFINKDLTNNILNKGEIITDFIQDNIFNNNKEKKVENKINNNTNNIKNTNNINNINNTNYNKENIIIKNNEQIKLQEKKDQLAFNKELCKAIASSLPKRVETNYRSFKDLIRAKTEDLSDKEKAYIIFLWICDNISYDADSFFAGRNVDCSPEGVFKTGSSVCSGYSRLYKDFALYLNLEVECVSCYAKGVGYNVGDKLTSTDHEYNVIKLNNKWYPIDSTWGAGHINNMTFIKSYNEFYFLANPELLIKTHFPQDSKWQLTSKKYTKAEFEKWPLIKSNFYTYGFERCFPEEGLIELKNRNNQKFIVYGSNMNQKGASCNIYLLKGNCYQEHKNLSIVDFYEDRFEANTVFNEKGKYKVQIFGNNKRGETEYDILEYAVNVQNKANTILTFPTYYTGKEDLNIIEPLYNNLKSGEKVKFRMTSNYQDIIIIDEDWNYLERNEQGYLELELIIKTKKGQKLIVGYKNSSGSCSYLVTYDII